METYIESEREGERERAREREGERERTLCRKKSKKLHKSSRKISRAKKSDSHHIFPAKFDYGRTTWPEALRQGFHSTVTSTIVNFGNSKLKMFIFANLYRECQSKTFHQSVLPFFRSRSGLPDGLFSNHKSNFG
jgi:hypothetical protein